MADEKTKPALPAGVKTVSDAASAALASMNLKPPADQAPPAQKPVEQPPAEQTPPAQKPADQPADDLTAKTLRAMGVLLPDSSPPVSTARPPAEADVDPVVVDMIEKAARHDPRIAHTFAKLRTDNKALSIALAEKEALIAQASSTALTGTERAELAKQVTDKDAMISDLQERLGRVSLESSPQFQAKYDQRINATADRLAQSLTQFAGISAADAPSTAVALLQADVNQLNTKLADVSPAVAGLIMSTWQEVNGIRAERKATLSEWRKAQAALKVETQNTQITTSIQERQKIASEALVDAATKGCFVYTHVNTPESQEAAKQYRDAFEGFVQTADMKELVRKAADGFAAPTLYRVLDLQRQRIKQLESLVGVQNNVQQLPIQGGGHDAPPPAAPKNRLPEGKTSTERRENAAAAAVSALGGVIR